MSKEIREEKPVTIGELIDLEPDEFKLVVQTYDLTTLKGIKVALEYEYQRAETMKNDLKSKAEENPEAKDTIIKLFGVMFRIEDKARLIVEELKKRSIKRPT